MKSKYPFYNSNYFKSLSINQRLMIRLRRTWFKIHCGLDRYVISKLRYGIHYKYTVSVDE